MMEVPFRRSKFPVTILLEPFRRRLFPLPLLYCALLVSAVLQLACSAGPGRGAPADLTQAPARIPEVSKSVQEMPAANRLAPGKPLERELGSGERDEISLFLEAGQYARVTLDQSHLDVAAALLDPEGKEVFQTDGLGGRKEPELIVLVTSATGEYRLLVTSHASGAPRGRYKATLDEVRPARLEDGDRVRAELALSEASHCRQGENPDEDLPKAFARVEEALSLWERIGDPSGKIRTLLELGNLHLKKDREKATSTFEQALSLSIQAHNSRGELRARKMLGSFGEIPSPAKTEHFGKALAISMDLGDTGEQADVLYKRGSFEFDQARYSEALRYFSEALPLAQSAGDLRLEAEIRNGIGGVYAGRGDSGDALKQYEQALALAQKEEDLGAEAACRTNLGGLLRRRGELQAALNQFLTALDLNERTENRGNQGVVLNHLGSVYMDLGDMDKALAVHEQALELWREIGDQRWEGATELNIGQVYLRLEQWQTALERFERARILATETKHSRRLGGALHGIGVALLNLGQTDAAIRSLNEALLWRRGSDRLGEALTLLELGEAHRKKGAVEQALSLMNQALPITRQGDASFGEASTLFGLARLERDRGNLEEALAHINQSIEILESIRSNLAGDRLRSSFLATRRSYYDFGINLLLQLDRRRPGQGYQAKALQMSERARARSLLDLLAEGRLDLTRGISAELKQREIDVTASLSQIRAELLEKLSKPAPDEIAIANLQARLQGVEAERERLVARILQEYPRYGEVRYLPPLRFDEIRTRLDKDSALLEYFIGEEGCYVFVVTSEDLQVHEIPDRQAIADEIEAVRNGVERVLGRRSLGSYTGAAHRLYQKLIAPAGAALAGKTHLLISPDGPLHLLAFEVLLTESAGDRGAADLPYLLRKVSVSYVPSASVLSWLADPEPAGPSEGRAKKFVAFADPIYGPEAGERVAGELARRGGMETALPDQDGLGPAPRLEGTAREVAAIAKRYPPSDIELYERDEANKRNVKDNLLVSTAKRLHFATHGVLNERQPEFSGLRLTRTDPGDDGILAVHEIFNLDLNAELVVLSACETGRGKEVLGEGLMGMTRAFLYAGTPSVVVSLWRVADAQTPDLMLRFYEDLDRMGDKAEALRQAKLAMIRRGGSIAQPYYWAPFILVGKR